MRISCLIRSIVLLLAILFICPNKLIAAAQNADFYVSPDGNDSWSGKVPEVNSSKTDGPFATLQRARDAVREFKKANQKLNGAITICLKQGNYKLNDSFKFTEADSGTAEIPVIYSAAKGQKVVISGGKKITGWQPYKDEIQQAVLDVNESVKAKINSLYYNGTKQHLARVPNFDKKDPLYGGFAYTTAEINEPNTAKLKYDPNVIMPSKWSQPSKAVLDIFPGYNYGNRRMKIKGADVQNAVLSFEKLDYKPLKGDRFFIENIFEELDAPSEWYLNASRGIVYFRPDDKKSLENDTIIPVASNLIKFDGARYVELRGLILEYCTGSAITLQNAEHCTIAGCTIRNTGEKGIELLPKCNANKIISNDIYQTGDYAVYIIASLFKAPENSQNIVSNNHIHDFGTVLKEIAGVGILGAGENVVSHNLIHDGPRWGVFVNSGAKNIIEYNRIYQTSLETEDTGAIYIATAHEGWIPNLDPEKNKLLRGNIVRYNLVHDTVGYGMTGWWNTNKGQWTKPYYSWSIYLDLGACGTHIYGNICYNSQLGGLMFGTLDNTAENNIFVGGKTAQVCTIKWEPPTPKPEITVHMPCGNNRVERNIIYYTDPNAYLYWFVYQYGSGWEPNEFSFNNNIIYYKDKTLKIRTAGSKEEQLDWQLWLNRKMDTKSVLADPKFVNASRNDYRLQKDSPAFKMGFKPIPVEKIGLYVDEYRKTVKAD